MVKIHFSEKVTDNLKRKQVVGVGSYEEDYAMKANDSINDYDKKISSSMTYYNPEHYEQSNLTTYASFDEERRCDYYGRGSVYPNHYSPIQVSETSNSLISPRVKFRRRDSNMVTPDRINIERYNTGYSIGHSLSFPMCGGGPYINHSMSYESVGDPMNLPPPPSCPFSPSSKSCFKPVLARIPSVTMPGGTGIKQAIFRRQPSVAMSDASWNDLAKVASVDEDEISCHSMLNDHEAREDNSDIYDQQSCTQSFSFSNDDHSTIMPLPFHHKESIEEAFSCPKSPQKKKEIAVSVLTTSTEDRDQKAISNAIYNWTQEDDEKLVLLMKRRRGPVKDWNAIARDHNRGKSGKECNERWIRYLKPGVKKGQWKPSEDSIVFKAVTSSNEQPFTKWSELAAKLPGRAGKQIRDRWVNYLNPAIHHLPFTREDDILLFQGHAALGKRWAEISLKFFNGSRSENQIKNRWYSASFKKFIIKEYGEDAYDNSPVSSATSSATEVIVSK